MIGTPSAGRITALVGVLGLTACATSRVTAFRDPEYGEARFSKIAVFALGMNLESAVDVERQVCSRLAPTGCLSGKSILPPTRQYADSQVVERIVTSGADAVLIVALVSDQADTRYIGTVTNAEATASSASSGQVNLYGSSGYWSGSSVASASGTSVSMPVYGHSREARALLALYEAASGNIVWSGEITTTGSGKLTVTNSEFIRSSTSKIAEEIKLAGLVGREAVAAASSPNQGSSANKFPASAQQRQDIPEVLTNRSPTPAYEAPTTSSKVVYRVMKDAALPVVARLDGWYRVQIRGAELYVRLEDVRRPF